VEIKSCIIMPTHIEPALRLMKTFARALEEAGAKIKTLNVRSKLFNDLSKRKLCDYRDRLAREEEPEKSQLFQRMINVAGN
jgi:hypothetical protein